MGYKSVLLNINWKEGQKGKPGNGRRKQGEKGKRKGNRREKGWKEFKYISFIIT